MNLKRTLPALLVAAGTAFGAIVAAPSPAAATGQPIIVNAPLTDLSTSTVDATDGAQAYLVSFSYPGWGTRTVLVLTGLNAEPGTTYGAHVHVGPCVEDNGAAAGPHYNAGGGVSPSTEIWLDFTVRSGGFAVAQSHVPFVIAEGDAQSVVIHRQPTDENGGAGARQACLPVAF
jgi:Cu/Zn superoxide dismutase